MAELFLLNQSTPRRERSSKGIYVRLRGMSGRREKKLGNYGQIYRGIVLLMNILYLPLNIYHFRVFLTVFNPNSIPQKLA